MSFGALWYISPDTVGQITDRLTKAKHSGEVQVFMNSADTMAGAEKTVGGAASGDAYTQKNTPGSQNTEATQNAAGVQDTEMAQKCKWIAGYISGARHGGIQVLRWRELRMDRNTLRTVFQMKL